MAYQYSVTEWLLFFYIYCFFGWCIESTFVSCVKKKLVNRGFMRGPFLPLYGSGAVLMLFVTIPFRDNLILMFLAGAIAASILEYFTGVAMEAIFKVRYWDYSKNKFNLNGHICLGTSLAWGGLTIALVKIIHLPVEKFVLSIPKEIQGIIALVLTIYIAVDFTLSFKAALDIKDILVKMEKAREELERMQKRLNAMIAFRSMREEEKKETRREKISEMLQDVKKKLEQVQLEFDRTDIKDKKNEKMKQELEELKETYVAEREKRSFMREHLDFYKRGILKAHPTISSVKFKDVLAELKEVSEEKKDQDKKNKKNEK